MSRNLFHISRYDPPILSIWEYNHLHCSLGQSGDSPMRIHKRLSFTVYVMMHASRTRIHVIYIQAMESMESMEKSVKDAFGPVGSICVAVPFSVAPGAAGSSR